MTGPSPGKSAVPIAARHRGREAAVQMLYQWEVGRRALADGRQVRPTSPSSRTPWPKASPRTWPNWTR